MSMDEISPLQHQLLAMDRQRPDRQTGLHTSGKIVHNSSASLCSYIYVWPLFISSLLFNKTPWMKHSITWLRNMLVPFSNMYTTYRGKCWWQQLHLLQCSWCHFLPINVLLEHSKTSVSPAVMPKSSSLAFISAAAVSAKTSAAALSCQLPQGQLLHQLSTAQCCALLAAGLLTPKPKLCQKLKPLTLIILSIWVAPALKYLQ